MTAVTGTPALRIDTIRGDGPGPTVALVAGVHGGKRAATRALEQLRAELRGPRRGDLLRGTILLVPVANPGAAGSGLAQLSPADSLNLNRVFPGRPDGRPTERLAHLMMADIVAQSDYLIDLHGADGEEQVGAFAYAARPGLDPRVDSAALRLATLWGAPRVVWDADGPRTLAASRFLQTAAHLSGVPAITVFEAGRASDDTAATAAFLRGAHRALAGLGLLAEADGRRASPVVHSRRLVALADSAGHWEPRLEPGARVAGRELLGTLRSSSGVTAEVRAEAPGVILHIRLPGRVVTGTPVAILAADQ